MNTGASGPVDAAGKQAGAGKPLNAAQARQAALVALNQEIGSRESVLCQVSCGDLVLSGSTDDLVASAYSGRPTSPKEKSRGEKTAQAYLLIDRALTALGYRRRQFINPGTPEVQQINWGWINNRLHQFYQKVGLIEKDRPASSVRLGTVGLAKLREALGRK